MAHIPELITDLALILTMAGIVSILFKWLKQPVVLGYIVAGALASSSVDSIPTVTDMDNVRIWAEIGVIFLLFALGLDFSFKKLVKVGRTATTGAITILVGMIATGYTTGMLLDWGHMNSLFLGGMISMSSTTIIFKAFDELGLRTQHFTGVVLGVLIVEDLFAILLMVLLSTLAVGQHFEGSELINSSIKLMIFLLFSFVTGITLLPTMLKKAKRHLNDETLLIVSIGLCLGMVLIATKAGFSAALGAFMMGSILAETIEAEHIERVIKPVKDLFGAIFFVSVGMMIDPVQLWQYKEEIAILVVIVMGGQMLFSSFGVLLSGQSLKVAVQSGCSLCQIGEFAFIIASLGVTLGVTSDFLYPIVVAVSVVTTFFTPYMMRFSNPIYSFVKRKLPPSILRFIEQYSTGSTSERQRTTWHKLLHAMLRIVVTYTAIIIVIIVLWIQLVDPWIQSLLPQPISKITSLTLVILLIAPMLRAIIMKKNRSEEFIQLWRSNRFNHAPLVSLIVGRIVLCIILLTIPISQLLHSAAGVTVFIAGIVIAFSIFSRQLKRRSILMERRFLSNLQARERHERRRSIIPDKLANRLLMQEIHLTNLVVPSDSCIVGHNLFSLQLRQRFHINVVTVVRGELRQHIPDSNTVIYPHDQLVLSGSDKDLESFAKYLKATKAELKEWSEDHDEMILEQFVVDSESKLIGYSIAEVAENSSSKRFIILHIERSIATVRDPQPTTRFEQDDIVWIVGKRENIQHIIEGNFKTNNIITN